MVFPTTRERVPRNTAEEFNQRIADMTHARVEAMFVDPTKIPGRLEQLDREWDIERTIEANAATLALAGTLLGIFYSSYWLILPLLVTGFLLQHALQGWCPPVPILRRLGFRTAYEIEQERHALKALRGDYRLPETSGSGARAVIEAAER